jgi:hypothetical protein
MSLAAGTNPSGTRTTWVCDQDEPQAPWSRSRARITLPVGCNWHRPRVKGTPIDILLVELPVLLRDAVRRRIEQVPDARVGEVGLGALRQLAGCRTDATAVVWARTGDGARWEPQRDLLAPRRGLRVLRVDDPGESAVLFEMRATAQVLPDIGLDALLEVATRDE